MPGMQRNFDCGLFPVRGFLALAEACDYNPRSFGRLPESIKGVKMLQRKNSKAGFSIRSSSAPATRRTFVVLGAPRGGTSLIAGALRLAGVFMGEEIDQANNEDLAFTCHKGDLAALADGPQRAGYLDAARRTIAARNASHAVWGWKDPLSALYVEELLPALVNPRFILVTRDITAAAMRERIEGRRSLKKAEEPEFYLRKTRQSLTLYAASLALIERTSAPVLFVSYEKASRNAEDFAGQLLDFALGRAAKSAAGKAAWEAIRLYTRENAPSADLAHRPAVLDGGMDGSLDLSRYPDLGAVYHACATLINQRHYEAGLALARRVLAQMAEGFDAYPRLNANPVLLAEVEAGMCFMSAIAQVNLGDGAASYMALGRFSAVATYLRVTGQNSELVRGMLAPADELMARLERELGG